MVIPMMMMIIIIINWHTTYKLMLMFVDQMKDLQAAGHNVSAATIIHLKVSKQLVHGYGKLFIHIHNYNSIKHNM